MGRGIRRPRDADPLRGRLHGGCQSRSLWHPFLLRQCDGRVWALLPNPLPGTAHEGDWRRRHHPGGPEGNHHVGRDLRSESRDGSNLARSRTHRNSQVHRGPGPTVGGGRHRAGPRHGVHAPGVRTMSDEWIIAAVGLSGTLLLLTNKAVPAMFLLLVFGVACGAYQHPDLLRDLLSARAELHLPRFALSGVTWQDLLIGTTLLALPQLPLTLGNAVIAIREENNRLFTDRAVGENTLATSTGVMNLASAALGGVPICHGAGGAPIILGSILLCLAFFLSDSISAIFALFARPVLGVILLLTGAQLALGSCDFSKNKGERFITITTAAFSMWIVGLAFVAGMTFAYLLKRCWLRL